MSATEEAHAAAVLALLNTALTASFDASVRAYDLDEVSRLTTKPKRYVEVEVYRRFGDGARLCGGKPTDLWRVLTRYVSDTVTNSRALREASRGALEMARVSVGGATTTPVQFETASSIQQDNEHWWTGQDAWTYAH